MFLRSFVYHIPSPVAGFLILVAAVIFRYDFGTFLSSKPLSRFQEARCLLKSNYVLMEISRPLSECDMCRNVTGPLILQDPSKFREAAYESTPIIVKGAASMKPHSICHSWPAMVNFSFDFFAQLYDNIELDGYYDRDCQFLPFKTDFDSLHQVFDMKKRNSNFGMAHQWYVGWSNCHPKVRDTLREFYQAPKFLPVDSELSALDWIFMGSPGNATTMHLDYVLRPSWQAQISGKKIWQLMPPPECESVCQGFNFVVQKGDIVFLDTNQWYHSTYVLPEGGLSISVGSEYD